MKTERVKRTRSVPRTRFFDTIPPNLLHFRPFGNGREKTERPKGKITFAAPAGAEITIRPGAPNMSVENGLPENEWDNFYFSNIVP